MVSLFILATIGCIVDLFASFVIRYIVLWWCSESSEDQALRRSLITLKKEMNSISMVDEFSKHAKLQRKYIKLEAEAKEKINNRSLVIQKLRTSFHLGVRVLNGMFISTLLYLYRYEPVILYPEGYLWPFSNFLSWPCGVDNCISLPVWIALMKLSVSYVRLSA